MMKTKCPKWPFYHPGTHSLIVVTEFKIQIDSFNDKFHCMKR